MAAPARTEEEERNLPRVESSNPSPIATPRQQFPLNDGEYIDAEWATYRAEQDARWEQHAHNAVWAAATDRQRAESRRPDPMAQHDLSYRKRLQRV